ncbi:MAG: hypothetical protein RL557_976 [archaeon]|jgi:endonuclease-3
MNQLLALQQFRKIRELQGSMRLAAEEWDSPFQTLIATILSARSLDETTIKICEILFKKYPDAPALARASVPDIQKIIRPINFYKNKSRYILACAQMLEEKYNGNVPLDYHELTALPGVGNKTANVFLSEQGHNTIGVDTHVHYISRYLGWSSRTKAEDVEQDLKKLFPESYWKELNPVLVKFGKKYTSRKEKNKLLEEIRLNRS